MVFVVLVVNLQKKKNIFSSKMVTVARIRQSTGDHGGYYIDVGSTGAENNLSTGKIVTQARSRQETQGLLCG